MMLFWQINKMIWEEKRYVYELCIAFSASRLACMCGYFAS